MKVVSLLPPSNLSITTYYRQVTLSDNILCLALLYAVERPQWTNSTSDKRRYVALSRIYQKCTSKIFCSSYTKRISAIVRFISRNAALLAKDNTTFDPATGRRDLAAAWCETGRIARDREAGGEPCPRPPRRQRVVECSPVSLLRMATFGFYRSVCAGTSTATG
jgi:hypothetical protein